MPDSVFSLLDSLDRQARHPSTRSQQHHDRGVPGYGYGYDQSYQQLDSHTGNLRSQQYSQHWRRVEEDEAACMSSPPMDTFDQAVLRCPADERQREAAGGRARLSLVPRVTAINYGQTQASQLLQDHSTLRHRAPRPEPSRLELAQYSFSGPHVQASSSSPTELPSSPSFGASQRQRSKHTSDTRQQHRANMRREAQPLEPVTPVRTFRSAHLDRGPQPLTLPHAPPTIQGIELIPTSVLPDRFRSVFPMPLFNAVQSKCYPSIYKTNNNFVLASPTGSGKTCVLELAICRLINSSQSGNYKIVYQAPTKSLCSERYRDWQAKFGPLDLQCAELTGDTDQAQLRNVQNASIIITTPEKWDSMTRKWKDHGKLMRLIKLFLIDEVHILKDDRGAALEAVVSRMKSVGSDVRFLALSATVPNSEDIATWLGKDAVNQDIPATREVFGEEFRPVKLQKHVHGYHSTGNDFILDKMLDNKLPEIITRYSQRKPIMIFCSTRPSTVSTAKVLANWWNGKMPKERYWGAPSRQTAVMDEDLRYCISSGVAFHNAGLDQRDRCTVEDGYLAGQINVICCTSTLTVGVNLPCHFVIIKNTANFQGKEYADLEIMQMLGRAGRPQFGDSAVAVILTKMDKVRHYEQLVSGQEILESRLHLNLIEHLSAEIGLGTVSDLLTAKRWLASTFLYVRLRQNPDHYRLDGDVGGRNLEERLEGICSRDLDLLQKHELVKVREGKLRSTEFGDAMARYYVQFDTMRTFLELPPKSRTSAILSALAQASEFKEIRFRSGEKPIYKEINTSDANPVKYQIPVNLDLPAHKVSLIIQATLGGIEFPTQGGKDKFSKHKIQYATDQTIVFSHATRLIRCITDIQLHLEDSTTALHALALGRSLSARVWDDSPLQMKQIEDIGNVAVRKLVNAGIKSIEDLENSEPHRIDAAVSRRPGFGFNVLNRLKSFPKLRVSLKMTGQPMVRIGECVGVKVKAEVGFLNERLPVVFNKKPVYVCLLAETSDGHKVYFCRMSAKKLQNDEELLFYADFTSKDQVINCYVMCDQIAGTQRQAMLKPDIPVSSFPKPKPPPASTFNFFSTQDMHAKHNMNISRRRTISTRSDKDLFDDEGIDDEDMIQAAEYDDFADIDAIGSSSKTSGKNKSATQSRGKRPALDGASAEGSTLAPQKLANGKWACNHKCKDKAECKHLCCREGCDKPPKAPAKAKTAGAKTSATENITVAKDTSQTKLRLEPVTSRKRPLTPESSNVEHLDLSKRLDAEEYATNAPWDYRKLHRLHSKVQKALPVKNISNNKPLRSYSDEPQANLTSVTGSTKPGKGRADQSSEFDEMGSAWWEDLPSPTQLHYEDDKMEDGVERMPAQADEGEDVPDVEDQFDVTNDMDGSGLEDEEAEMFGAVQPQIEKSDEFDPVATGEDIPHFFRRNDNTTAEIDEDDGVIAPWSDPPQNEEAETSEQPCSKSYMATFPQVKGQSLFLNSTSSPEKSDMPMRQKPTTNETTSSTVITKRPLTSSDDGNSQPYSILPKRHKFHTPPADQKNADETIADLATEDNENKETIPLPEEDKRRQEAERIKQEKGYDDIDISLIMGLEGYVEFV